MDATPPGIGPDQPEAYFNRELSWLAFAARVLALAEDPELPLLERVKFAGILGMLHDEFFMKRVSGLKKLVRKGSRRRSLDGRTPEEEMSACGRRSAGRPRFSTGSCSTSCVPRSMRRASRSAITTASTLGSASTRGATSSRR